MRGLSYKWVVMMVAIFGLFMVMLDLTIVNIAIPKLQTDFGAGLTDVDWVSTGYSLAEGIGIPLTPYFSAVLGNKRFYLLLLALFTIGSALCGVAWSLSSLTVFRILQGLAGAGMIPMSITLLYSEFPPEERGIALGALGVPLMVAPALGPTVGGYLVTFVSWRVIFYINVPIGILGFFLGAIFLRDNRPEGGRTPSFDIAGFLCSTVALGSLLYAFDKAGTNGWDSLTVTSFLVIGLASLVLFVIVELITIESGRQPLLDLRLFGSRSFAGGNIALMIIAFALFGGQFLVPQYLQTLRGLSAYNAGLVLLPQALGSMVASVLGGRLVDKLGVKAVTIPGLLILASSLWGLSRLTLQTPFSDFQILLIIRGLGLGLCMQQTTIAALAEIKPAQLSQASSLNSVVRSVATSFAVALVSTLVTARTVFHFNRLTAQVTPDSMAGQALQQRAAYLAGSQGMGPQQAMGVAIGEMMTQLQQQAYLLAMNDAFLLTLGAIFIAIFVVLFVVRAPRKKARALPKQEHMALEGAPAEEREVSAAREAPIAEPAAATHQTRSEASATDGEQVTVSSQRSAVSTVDEEPITASHQGNGVSKAGEKLVAVSPYQGNGVSKMDGELITVPLQNNPALHERRKDTSMRRLMRRSVVIPAIILALILVGGVVSYFIYNSYNFYATDDAQVTGTMVNIVAPTSGTLINLNVQVGMFVSARQVIGTVQPTGFGPAPVQHLIAPMNGVIVQVPGSVGQLVNASTTTVAQETDPNSMKITAYIDESAIKIIAVGQAVDIHIDAYNTTVTGHVTDIVGATAGQFSLLPTSDNSSGNYTKVSQRVPVDIQLDNPADAISLLPGMSVEVTIHLH
jgi:EmrB/QacA subfamily drug resistance transporter